MSQSLNNASSVCNYIDRHMQTFKFKGHEQAFLPKSAFETVTQKEVIQQILADDEELYMSSSEETEFVERVYRNGRKLFATCVYCDLPMTCLKALLDDGLTDANVPIKEEAGERLKQKRRFKTGFIRNQKRFHTPYFEMGSFKSLDDGFSIPISFEESKSNWLNRGAFGEVWKIRIHCDHRSFSSATYRDDLFAMKVTEHGGRELVYHQDMAHLKHPHLVNCFASFTFGERYHMVYELANCDLEKLMRENPDATQVPGLTDCWLAKQLYGLASALNVVHNQGGSEGDMDPNRLGIPEEKPTKTGYIHDIKPENILVFIYDGNMYWFRLSDFSCAKIAEYNRLSHLTESRPGTPTYRAPEVITGKTSRPFDLWSLGCVYLELLVWFFEGYQELEDFRTARLGENRPGGPEDDGFYHVTGMGANETTQLREPVLEKIKELSRQCEGEIKVIADAIPSLLEIDPKKRPTARKLLEERLKPLKHLDSGADPDFELTHAKALPANGLPQSSLLTCESDSDIDDAVNVKFTFTRPTDDT